MSAPPLPPLRHVRATRYVTPLREGGSLPAICEADDLGTYVVKFLGAGQGRKALVAEVVTAAIAATLDVRVPELVLVELDPALATLEPDPEIAALLAASTGAWNLGVDYLPGSLAFDPTTTEVPAELAARILWLDAFVSNVDRSWRNPNLLVWHRDVWAIDHGAALYWAHAWPTAADHPARPYPQVTDHVLLQAASPLAEVDALASRVLDRDTLRAATALVPDAWLVDEPGFGSAEQVRDAYVDVLGARLADRRWLTDVEATRGA